MGEVGLSGLYHCWHTNYCRAFHLCRVLFSTKPKCSAKHFLAAELSYCWLYPSKQAIDCFMLFAYLDRVLFSRLERSVKEVLTVALSARAIGLLIVRSINNITGPTNTRIQPGYKLI